MEHKIIVVGIGPGSKEYMIPAAIKAIEQAEALVGSNRAMEQYGKKEGQNQFIIHAELNRAMVFIRSQLAERDVVVMVSGDPGYYSLLDAIQQIFEDEVKIEIIPGLSSMQVAFAKLGLPWHDAELISMHGRKAPGERMVYQPGKILGFLTDKKNNSKTIPAMLRKMGWPARTMVGICNRLSYPDEKIIITTIGEAAKLETVYLNCVLVVKS
ncbi:MAG: precorrin-6y C5,15-methyltransferase (decarboxylating) subunit CbiE [Anaerovibrio sp.]|uniref:precorrin-6y C5,15-methyltransferase (decarboxylating) subunit CbiE n=1 Tax=Anaerovibrio sp. TaxID=1872532 RepID=UPI0025C13299|nr:precorrin-6y C5,15-methyltransferase (decarboxylating) subunit CbiE [Anaerovibrio sp.]MBE6099674.1 precorrin-6y C5,15-methyltransferase (decarboxylating) subunit CbiE [Anaerovibrio sp.]